MSPLKDFYRNSPFSFLPPGFLPGQAGEPVPSKESWIKQLLAKPGDKAGRGGLGLAGVMFSMLSVCFAALLCFSA